MKKKRRRANDAQLLAEERKEAERKEALKAEQDAFLAETKQVETSQKAALIKDGLILPRFNILGAPKQSGFEPFAMGFANKRAKRKRRKRKKVSAYD